MAEKEFMLCKFFCSVALTSVIVFGQGRGRARFNVAHRRPDYAIDAQIDPNAQTILPRPRSGSLRLTISPVFLSS